jgi:hypothetical protein
VWSYRIRDRHVVSVRAARPGPQPPAQPTSKHTLGANIKRLSECFSSWKTIGNSGTAERFGTSSSRGTAGTIGTALLDVFKAMEGFDPQVKRKILSDNTRRFYVPPIGRFERLEQSAAVERLERAVVIGERLNRALILFTGPPTIRQHGLR